MSDAKAMGYKARVRRYLEQNRRPDGMTRITRRQFRRTVKKQMSLKRRLRKRPEGSWLP